MSSSQAVSSFVYPPSPELHPCTATSSPDPAPCQTPPPCEPVDVHGVSRVSMVAQHTLGQVERQTGSSSEGSMFPRVPTHVLDQSRPDYVPPNVDATIGRYRPKNAVTHPFLRNALLLQERLPNVALDQVRVVQVVQFKIGRHCLVLKVLPNQPTVVPELSNDQILIKTFSDYSIRTINDSQSRIRSDAAANVLHQYVQMKNAHIPVMEIYNFEQATQNCGYFVVENVPTPLTLDWNLGARLATLTLAQRKVLREIRTLFKQTYGHNIHADLRPDNLRRRLDSTLVFTDLRENRPDEEEFEEEMRMDFPNMLQSFRCEPGDEIYQYLSRGWLSKRPGYLLEQ